MSSCIGQDIISSFASAGKHLLGVPQGLDSIAMLSAGCDFEQGCYHKSLETSWAEVSAEQVDWLRNGCEQAIKKIEKEVFQVTEVQKLGDISNTT